MKIRFFKNVKTRQELKKVFITLLKKYHPDNGGDEETCKQLNAEYEYLYNRLPDEKKADATESTAEEKKAAADMDKLIRDILEKIIYFDIDIEVVGTWIWIDARNTYQYKEQLKAVGFKWSKARNKWYCSPYKEFTFYKKGTKASFDTLRSVYGSEKIETKKRVALA